LKVIATINQIAVKSQLDDYNPYLAYKIYKHAIDNATSLAARPFNFQSKIMDLNDSILNLDIGKTNATISNVKDYQIKYPSDDSINVVSAAAHVTNKTGKAVFTRLETMFKSNPKDVGLALILVQLCMSSGNITGATWILELLLTSLEPEKRYQPGLIGLLVAMYKHQGRSRHVRNLLSEASKWWMESPNPVYIFLFREKMRVYLTGFLEPRNTSRCGPV
jgi:signal recognition particle subunit SRP72